MIAVVFQILKCSAPFGQFDQLIFWAAFRSRDLADQATRRLSDPISSTRGMHGRTRQCCVIRIISRSPCLSRDRSQSVFQVRVTKYSCTRGALITHFQSSETTPNSSIISKRKWSEWRDSNSRPSGPKPDALPDCATLRSSDESGNTRFTLEPQH